MAEGPDGSLRVGFAGTPAFARVALAALLQAGHRVPLVLTQPDRPAGRGLKLNASAVKQLAIEHSLPVLQPRSLRLDGKYPGDAQAAQAALQSAELDVLVVAAYGLLLPPWVLARPRQGCLNIHGSLLPRWRGAAPAQRAIEAGDSSTGITIMQMDAGLDTGDILLTESVAIAAEDTGASLTAKLAEIGAGSLLQALTMLTRGALQPRPQPAQGVTYAHKIDKTEASIDWSEPAEAIERRLRAFDPFPGCTTVLAGQTIKVWRGRAIEGAGTPGQVLHASDGRLELACCVGALELLQLQLAGGRRISAREFLQGHPIATG